MGKIKYRLSFIFAISLILTMTVGGFVMPSSDSYAEAEAAPILKIEQRLDTEGERTYKDYTFNYEISALNENYPMPEGAESGKWGFNLTNNDSLSIHFLTGDEKAEPGTIAVRFSNTGIYHYTLTQKIQNKLKNVTYDESIYDINVKVISGNGLEIEAVWVQRETGEKPDSIEFVNNIRVSKVLNDPPIRIVKRIEGDAPKKDDEFVFVMKPEQENFPLPYGARGQYEVSIYGEGEIEIGIIEFTAPGIYKYTVSEKSDAGLNYSFDSAVYNISYKVDEKEDGTLTSEREIIREGTDEEECVFTNIHNALTTTPKGDTRKDSGSGRKESAKKPGRVIKTGDVNNLSHYLALMLMSLVVLQMIRLRKKRS